MKAVIKLDVPEYQIDSPVTVYFKDTMRKNGTCEKDKIVYCKDCKHSTLWKTKSGVAIYECGSASTFHDGSWFCADGEVKHNG